MASSTTAKPPGSPASTRGSPFSRRTRRDSVNSISASSLIDKEQMSSTLDKIHNSASQSGALTTFNDFAPPPRASPAAEGKASTGDLVHHGLSGLYTRFREAVGAVSPTKATSRDDDTTIETASKRTSLSGSHISKNSVSSLNRSDGAITTVPESLQTVPSKDLSSRSASISEESRGLQQPPSSRGSVPLITGSKPSSSSGRPLLGSKPKSSSTIDPVTASAPNPPNPQRDASRSTIRTDGSGGQESRRSLGRSDTHHSLPILDIATFDATDGRLLPISNTDDASSYDGSMDAPTMSPHLQMTSAPANHTRSPSASSSMLSPDHLRRKPAVIDRISRSRSTVYSVSRDSSLDRGGAPHSPVEMAASEVNSHEALSRHGGHARFISGDARDPSSTTSHEGASDHMSAQLDRMGRRQVLGKEFWMKDDTVKECYLCQAPFSAFRRKHHCRACGCIFDSKCTKLVAGDKLGVQGTLRVCKRCLEAINRRQEGSASDDSGDEQSFMPRIFGPSQKPGQGSPSQPKRDGDPVTAAPESSNGQRPIVTPMMAIPATRRVNESNRNSAVLEIGLPQLSRPGSSRSLKSLTNARPQSSAGHKRHHSKHGFLGRLKGAAEERAPFRRGVDDDTSKRSKFPAFHDDNIIDPELADFMSDDSSGDEQVSIFATMNSADMHTAGFEQEKSNLSPFMNAGRKHRHRPGEKSISGMSHYSRGAADDTSAPTSVLNHRRSNRRRNMSNVSGAAHHLASPRPKSSIYKIPTGSTEALVPTDNGDHLHMRSSRRDSVPFNIPSNTDLNSSSLKHIDKLLHQLLEDADVLEPEAWIKSLVPILLRCTDDVSPNVAKGEDMDIRHYVKLKKIPGGRPRDTSYVSGVVFTKNLALKSMPRRIANPRILLVTFPIEYQRHQQHFMSLQPVIEGEREYLRIVVQRLAKLSPHLVLVEKGVSGIALQYFAELNISVAYNVKHTVIEAVARCAEADILSSLDRLALPVSTGRCSSFEVKTFVNNNFLRGKKSYIFLGGCRPDLGCTISLRGADSATLSKVKYIVEFMSYVVYNLRLESSLLRDESIEPDEGETSLSNSYVMNESFKTSSSTEDGKQAARVASQHSSNENEQQPQATEKADLDGAADAGQSNEERPKLPSLHDSHDSGVGDPPVPDDVPMPTFYSDMVAKYETKILSASPYVKFTQPHVLMRAREQERRLLYLRRLRDQTVIDEQDEASAGRAKFQLIKPEMVEKIGQKAPRQIMEILHAMHDAEYDKAFFNYQTGTRQWEAYIQGNLDLFDPYSHQNIVVLYSEICTETKIPCTEPSLIAINFYDEQHVYTGMDPDCTLGQYIQDLAETKDGICDSSGCERKLIEHHRTYVHDQYRITVFVEDAPPGVTRHSSLGDGITMWTYCKICKKDSQEVPMSDATYKYSFGKYLELLYWGRGLRIKHGIDCPHDHSRDHVRYFGFNDARVRIHWDPIDLLEIVVPRARITWKVQNDLKLKNEIFTRMEERWRKFMSSVKARLQSIRIDSVLPEKAELCKAEVEVLTKKMQGQLPIMLRKLEDVYVNSKYYEIVPFNGLVREMLEVAGEWDQAFAKFEADFLGDKDMRQLTMMQLKKMFTDESKETMTNPEETMVSATDSDSRPSQGFSEIDEKSTQPTECTDMDGSILRGSLLRNPDGEDNEKAEVPTEDTTERVEALDLAGSGPVVSGSSQAPEKKPAESSQAESAESVDSSKTASPPVTRDSASVVVGDGQSLTEKVDRMRREQARKAGEDASNNKQDERGIPRSSPPIIRATSQPQRIPRAMTTVGNPSNVGDQVEPAPEPQGEGSIKVDKRLSERLGLSALKQRGKSATSGIPRLVTKKKESKVSTLTRHFEQISREFEKERIRDKKKRAASLRHPRALLPRTSTKVTIQVYDDFNAAVEEPALMNDAAGERRPEQVSTPALPTGNTDAAKSDQLAESPPLLDPAPKAPDQISVAETDDTATGKENQQDSDDEERASDTEPSVSDEFLPDIKEIADSTQEIPLELPKHQRNTLMKYLTKFWAERSASGWSALDYPINPTDHIFVDSNVIVREDEPSSVIALALNSEDYKNKLEVIRREAQEMPQDEVSDGTAQAKSTPASEHLGRHSDASDLEKSLLCITGTHLKYQFKEGAAVMTCKIFYAEQFDALRRKCGIAGRIVESLSRCMKWDSRGGKTRSVFLKTLDDRLVLKSLSPIETSAFLNFAPGYFTIMAEALFHDLPSVIAKMLGFFQVIIKNPITGTDVKLDLVLMENLFYDRSPTRIFDLKGSMRNRKIQSTGEQNEVLLDENMVEYIYESPLFAREHSKKLLRASVWNDTLFLARQDVMDYSLMIAVDEARKELVVGIIDCIRTYTWDKKLESWIKDRGFAGGGRNRPTVTSPKEYKSRFREAMARYILQAPNCWHLFNNTQYPVYYSGRARFEDQPELQK
ncbi:1-phosphatidylinositol-3-phosphate 5-kinase (Fab1) [Cordyceps fumosorosea ARSEF 2679]|uniref:1-phosphatidylinositol-3-phosphate 5-kinase n=1 Tax=Cordyceps fumosorosea (strain ARSEF 2679) TaxID=1081104 RepID=A0A167V3H6_CORFA|nr:1-phosphatidylinositol-3-phosphate 5-kinase (Fab1) [Cordyceps fumosorosea ARSEF 2679]OAA62195.1 1-phosphatidylinositol-3-phosphate 5-kinase (Fab1) [Cordyceps fumosorosea ARSEF 2679]